MKQGDQDPSMSVFEHFWRLGLEKYAPHFERQCVCNISQFRNCDIDTVAASCVELELDAAALSALKKLQKEDADLMSSSYAEADTSTIRDLFFASFPSTDVHGNVTVYSRFKKTITKTRSITSRCKGSEGQAESPRYQSNFLGSDDTPSAGASRDNRSLLEIGTSVQNLIKCSDSQKKTPLLFHTSIFRIKQLFEWYQNRPHDLEAMLRKFATEPEQTICQFSVRQHTEYIAQELDLASFLKRMCLPPFILSAVHEMLIYDVKSFMEFCSSSSLHVLCSRFCLQADQAKRLLDFCSKDEKKNAHFRRKFLLPSKQDIRTFFTAFYTSSDNQLDDSTLEQYAIEFSEQLCDSVRQCTSVVSSFEIEEYVSAMLPAAARSEEALTVLKAPVANRERTENPFSPVFEHLFRVGLQQYAPAFMQCGATSVARFRAIEIDAVVESCPLLALDLNSQSQLKLLQKEDETYIMENYASASRLQVKQVLKGVGASDAAALRLLSGNVSLYLLKNMTAALPIFDQASKLSFDDSISALFQPVSMNEQQMQPLSFTGIVRRLNFPLEAFHHFDDFGSVQKFVKELRDGEIKGLSQRFGPVLKDRRQRSQLDEFCSSKSAVNSVARLKFMYPPTQDLAQAFVNFFSQCGTSMKLQDVQLHAFSFSRILSGWQSKGTMFPFRGRSYFSLFEVEAFLKSSFLSFAENKGHMTIHATVERCLEFFEVRQSDEYLKEPEAPEEPAPPPKSDVQLWLESVFPDDERTAAVVCRKLFDQAIRNMADFDSIEQLSADFLQSKPELKLGEAWKVHVAFNAYKAALKK